MARKAPGAFFRFELFYAFSEGRALGAWVAPRSLRGKEEFPEAIVFAGQPFPAHTRLRALYRLGFCRLTYRYRL